MRQLLINVGRDLILRTIQMIEQQTHLDGQQQQHLDGIANEIKQLILYHNQQVDQFSQDHKLQVPHFVLH